MATHPTIEAFQSGAELLEIRASRAGLDDAIAQFAAWVDLATDHLTEDDLTVLTEVGAILYRVGINSR